MGITVDQWQTWIHPPPPRHGQLFSVCHVETVQATIHSLVMTDAYSWRRGALIIPEAEFLPPVWNNIFSPIAKVQSNF